MALAIKDATYARDVAGRKKLLANLQSDIDNAIKAFTGTEYNTVNAASLACPENDELKLLLISIG